MVGSSVIHVSFRSMTEVLVGLGTYFIFVGLDSVVGLGTCCGLDDIGMKSWWGQDFLHQSRPGAHPVSCAMGTRSFSQERLG